MTRRRIYFQNAQSGRYYISPEFNGDRDEMKRFGCHDSCDHSWENILALFSDVTAAHHFMKAVATAQSCYHSTIPSPLPGVRIETVHSYDEVPEADEVYAINQNGVVFLDTKKSILHQD